MVTVSRADLAKLVMLLLGGAVIGFTVALLRMPLWSGLLLGSVAGVVTAQVANWLLEPDEEIAND